MSESETMEEVCRKAEESARQCLEYGEKPEDIYEAVFSQVFNFTRQDPESKTWAMNTASGIMKKVMDGKSRSDALNKAAPDLYRALKRLVLELPNNFHSDDADPRIQSAIEESLMALSRVNSEGSSDG